MRRNGKAAKSNEGFCYGKVKQGTASHSKGTAEVVMVVLWAIAAVLFLTDDKRATAGGLMWLSLVLAVHWGMVKF